MADFEVGSLTGATPFKMRTYIPYTYKTGQDLVFRGVGSPVEEMVLGYHSKNGYIPPIYQKLDIDNLQYLNGDNLKFAEDPLLTFNKNNLFIKTDKKKQGGKLNYLDYVGRTF